jgi:hypothetical protein
VSPWFSGCSARACSARCSTAFASACLSCTLALSSLCDHPRRGTQCSLASRTRGARTGRAGNRPQQPEVALGVDGCAWSSNPASVRVAAADRTSPHPHRPHVPKQQQHSSSSSTAAAQKQQQQQKQHMNHGIQWKIITTSAKPLQFALLSLY